MNLREITSEIRKIISEIVDYEPEETIGGRTTGEASGGRTFEKIVSQKFQEAFLLLAKGTKSTVVEVLSEGDIVPTRQRVGLWGIYNQFSGKALVPILTEAPNNTHGIRKPNGTILIVSKQDLQLTFKTDEVYAPYLNVLKESRHIPKTREKSYWELAEGLSTKFDGGLLFVENIRVDSTKRLRGDVTRKILMEIKAAKSSQKQRVDGNAHERFSFQNMEFLVWSHTHPPEKLGLLLLTNGAFLRYKNKYHMAFGIHAHLLRQSFGRFYKFQMISWYEDYLDLMTDIGEWLLSSRQEDADD
ncbi:MAG: hypothetical protein WHT26_07630 [Thermus sp.]|nr:hypothetical protein [Thermus oshimai]